MCVRENIMTVASKLNFYFIIIRYTMATATICDPHQGRKENQKLIAKSKNEVRFWKCLLHCETIGSVEHVVDHQ
jgi:hypothetical protein